MKKTILSEKTRKSLDSFSTFQISKFLKLFCYDIGCVISNHRCCGQISSENLQRGRRIFLSFPALKNFSLSNDSVQNTHVFRQSFLKIDRFFYESVFEVYKLVKLVKEYFFTACMCVGFKIHNPNICLINLNLRGQKSQREKGMIFLTLYFLVFF